jgi:uncharacterized protein
MGRVAWLAHAADAGDDGSRKLDQAWRVGRGSEGSGMRGLTRLPLDRAALSVALGRDNVVHLALTDRAAANGSKSAARLLRFRGGRVRPSGRTEAMAMRARPVRPRPVACDDELSFEGHD